MYQYCHNLIALAVVSISACIMIPCQAQTAAESNNSDSSKISPISTEPSIGINTTAPSQGSNSTSSTNNQLNISETPNNPSTSTAAPTTAITQPSTRIPIGSRIFAVPTMEQ